MDDFTTRHTIKKEIDMESTIRLFKAVEVGVNLTIGKEEAEKAVRNLFEKTIAKGFIFSPEVARNYTETELDKIIKIVEKEVGLTAKQMNSSFHKSWKKIKEASIEQLVIEQVIHYFTTYGFESLGIYDKDSVYIPNEKLEIPELEEGITLVVIKGYTKSEIKEKLLSMLHSGIALGEDTINDVTDVATFVELTEEEIESVKNKEVKVALYDYLGLFPENPIEFLRFLVYKSTKKTLLIKDSATIETIKANTNLDVLGLLVKYKKKHGLERLSEIFYRFKPIWLAFRTSKQLKVTINKIRRLAVAYHKPMKEDYLNEITALLKNNDPIDIDKLNAELARVNTFRKIRLAYALKFRTADAHSILYRVRNGKGFATGFEFSNKKNAKGMLDVVIDSIVEDVKTNVEGKKIYIPEYINYALPTTEKQFTGDFPSGTCVTVPKDMIVGIHWDNVDRHRIDLDLSLINQSEGKIGWDSSYRTENRDILFSGDITDAQKPDGASELFYVKRQKKTASILLVNYYNMDSCGNVEVPFKILVAKESPKSFSNNYMVNPNNVVSVAKTQINQKQLILGLLVTTTDECRFYYTETYIGRSITASESEFVKNSRQYLFDFYENTINLKDVLVKSGAEIVSAKEESDIDLSPESLEKDTIVKLVVSSKK